MLVWFVVHVTSKSYIIISRRKWKEICILSGILWDIWCSEWSQMSALRGL